MKIVVSFSAKKTKKERKNALRHPHDFPYIKSPNFLLNHEGLTRTVQNSIFKRPKIFKLKVVNEVWKLV